MYPPTAAVLLAPASAFGLLLFIIILSVINAIALIVSVLLSLYLTTGSFFRQHPLLYVAPIGICLPFIWDIYHLGQPNLMLLALMLGTLFYLQRGNGWAAGALLALGASIKAFPVLAVPYLVYRRQWKALAPTFAFLFIFLVLLPAPIRGFQRNLYDMKTWSAGMIHYRPKAIAQRSHRGYSADNQSLFAVANRILRPIKSIQKTHAQRKSMNVVCYNQI